MEQLVKTVNNFSYKNYIKSGSIQKNILFHLYFVRVINLFNTLVCTAGFFKICFCIYFSQSRNID